MQGCTFSTAKKEIAERFDYEVQMIGEMLKFGNVLTALEITMILSNEHAAALRLRHEPLTSFITI